jgi:prepilin-type N-terminal cleavage/methylation domain-containing protein
MRSVMRPEQRTTRGFTLIELLVVIAIVGILAAVAIPQFAVYRARGFNARVATDARSAATAEEAAFVDNNAYAAGDCSSLVGMTNSGGVICTTALTVCASGVPGFTVATSHPRATKSCTWNSCGQTCPDGTTGNLCCS